MNTLNVRPNPWAAVDKDGTPCAVVPRDVDKDAGGPGRFVGARIDAQATKILEGFKFDPRVRTRAPRQVTKYEYLGIPASDTDLHLKLAEAEPVALPNTSYYRDRVREGALIPADKKTAERCRVKFEGTILENKAPDEPPAAQGAQKSDSASNKEPKK